MKKIFILLISITLVFSQNIQAEKFNFSTPKIKESKLTVGGKKTMAVGGGVFVLGGLLYLTSTGQKVPNTNTYTLRGAINRTLSFGIMGAGVATTAIGGILFGLGKSNDAIKHNRKVSYYISPLGQVGIIVKL